VFATVEVLANECAGVLNIAKSWIPEGLVHKVVDGAVRALAAMLRKMQGRWQKMSPVATSQQEVRNRFAIQWDSRANWIEM
jgi:hypothetical protein